ncbi:unnamed protein product [Arabidopsis thaliana]|uniref:Dirigent protein n=1 Tax=Arabidopsis thaliana TaxID=3702 RepID=A0A7G2ES54_ARATH|nr:unnamed protein product [Arabidopsis thaliana]
MEDTGSIKQEAQSHPPGIFEIPGEPAVVINGVPDEPQTDCMIAKDEPISSVTVGSGEWLEGREVRKFFLGRYYSGTVTKFDKQSGWYRVEYEDGDSEDLDWSELEEVLLPLDTKNSNTNAQSEYGEAGQRVNVKAPYPGHKPEKLVTTTVKAPYPGHKPEKLIPLVDDILTVGPEITSEEVGRAQGIFAPADQNNFGLLMAFNFVFTKGEFSGSTVSMYGRNPIFSKVREMPIIGGTGAFRFGRGYAQAKTFTFNTTSGNAVVKYNVYIWH